MEKTKDNGRSLGLATVEGVAVQELETMLTFKISDETFAIEVGTVSEIIDPQNTTRVPNAGALAPTLVNVRGSIVPVIDLRYRLGMKPAELLPTSRMLVVEVDLDGETTKIAIMADEVEDVIETQTKDLEAVPELGIRWPVECFRGIATHGETLIIMLDPASAFFESPSRNLN